MNDDSALGTVRDSLTTAKDSLTEVRMGTPLDTIVRRGRATRRRHRLISLAGTGAVAVAVTAALAVGLHGVIGSTHRTGSVRTAAFTLVSNANGTATLTINPRVLLDPDSLQSDLKQDGIPAMVTVGSFCSSDPPPAGFLRVVSFQPKPRKSGHQLPVADPTVTFNPSAIPAGTELSFGNFQLANGQQTSFALIDTGAYTCTSTAPATPPTEGVMLRYGHPAS
jgi:hypothetical protein